MVSEVSGLCTLRSFSLNLQEEVYVRIVECLIDFLVELLLT